MFKTEIYVSRREQLKNKIKNGVLLFLGNDETPMNYAGNTYHFRQDSSFLYYWGLNSTPLAAIISIDKNEEIIFGDDRSIDDIVWMGKEESILSRAEKVGVNKVKPFLALGREIKKLKKKGIKIHYLPQYRQTNIIMLEELLGINHNKINSHVSKRMIKAVVEQRSVKSEEEIAEIEKALDTSYLMNTTAMRLTKPGILEREVFGALEGIAFQVNDLLVSISKDLDGDISVLQVDGGAVANNFLMQFQVHPI